MITDLVIGIFHSLYDGLVGLAPVMPERPLALSYLWGFLITADWYLPIHEITEFFPTMLVIFAGLALWRGIRLLLPGG